jgi:hypothetical protein
MDRQPGAGCVGAQSQSRIRIQRNKAVLRACQLLQAVAICNSITLLLT